MTFFKQLRNNTTVLIHNGKSYLFNLSGTCVQEDAGLTPDITNYCVKVNIISVLRTDKYTEIATDTVQTGLKKYKSNEDGMYVILRLQSLKKFSHILIRSGVESDIRYTQSFFVYRDDLPLDTIIKELNILEVSY